MGLKITWLGSASFMLEDSLGHVVFVDPWLDAQLDHHAGNPGCPIRVEDVQRADLVLVTHGDTAHYGKGDSAKIAARTGGRFASNPALCEFVVAEGVLPELQVIPLSLNQRHQLEVMNVTVFPVIHPPRESDGDPGIVPEPNTGFCISMDGVNVLYTGDTILDDPIYRKIADDCSPEVALLPINPTDMPARGTVGHSVEVAAAIAHTLRPRYVIPHYRYAPNVPGVDMLAEALEPSGIKVIRIEPGGTFSVGN